MNFRELQANEIEAKVKQISQKGAVILLYKTARTDMDLLDETVGAENWWCDYKEIKGNLFCGITILTENGAVTKWDCGIESREDGEGNEKKGEASDAFKRAGFRWGIGRELYTSPFIFIPAEKMNITIANGKPKTTDTFSVYEIVYENRKISAIAIVNQKTGEQCFSWDKNKKQKNKKPETKEAKVICSVCKKEVKAVTMKDGSIMPALDFVAEYGMCPECYKKHRGKANES